MSLQVDEVEANHFRVGGNEVGAWRELEFTRHGPHTAPHPVSDDRRAHTPADRIPHARARARRVGVEQRGHDHRPGPPSSAGAPQGPEGALVAHPADRHGESFICGGRARTSSRQPVPALEPPRPENGPACPRGHPVPEPVALGPLAIVGLIGPLHLVVPPSEPSSTLGERLRTSVIARCIVSTRTGAAVRADGARAGHGRRRADANARGPTHPPATSAHVAAQPACFRVHNRPLPPLWTGCYGARATSGEGAEGAAPRMCEPASGHHAACGAIGTMWRVGEIPEPRFPQSVDGIVESERVREA